VRNAERTFGVGSRQFNELLKAITGNLDLAFAARNAQGNPSESMQVDSMSQFREIQGAGEGAATGNRLMAQGRGREVDMEESPPYQGYVVKEGTHLAQNKDLPSDMDSSTREEDTIRSLRNLKLDSDQRVRND
jgi:hypothetical protein